ncbi:MAG: class D sortase [Acidimicrobiales bacterium]
MEQASSGAPKHKRKRRWTSVFMAIGVLLLLAAGAGIAYPLWWNNRSSNGGKHLVTNFDNTEPGKPVQVTADCVPSPPKVSDDTVPAGLIKIPVLKLTAPVLNGLTDAVLNVAAGHDPDSPWPGGTGESIIESHDVSYFSQISDLHDGDVVIWEDHCQQYQFKVIGHEVVAPGTLLSAPKGNGEGLALITCYPTTALYDVPTRYVLLTQEVSSVHSKVTPPPVDVVLPDLKVPAPPALVALGLQLDQNSLLLGTMNFAGSPSPAWKQGPASLDFEALALESYFGTEKAIADNQPSWWNDLSVPGLAEPSQWDTSADVYVTENVKGNTPVSITLSSSYVSMVLVAEHGDLLIQSVTIH